MQYSRQFLPMGLLIVSVTAFTMAEDAALPATAPSTTEPAIIPKQTHKAEIPPGFHVVIVAGRQILCEPAEEEWVTPAVQAVTSATRPATMPSDMLDDLKLRRSAISQDMMRDLQIPDQKIIDDFFDGPLATAVNRVQSIKPTVYYLVATRERVADLLAAGWSDPRFHYIRFAHDLDYSTSVVLSAVEPMDDLVWWVEIHPGDNHATRADALQQEIKFAEGGFVDHLSLMGKNEVEHEFQTFVYDQTTKNLKLPGTLEWFNLGVSHIYGIKYSSELTGVSRKFWTGQLIGNPEHRGNWNRIDLLNPVDPAEVRPELIEPYLRALMPKGALMIQILIDHGGDGVLAKALPSLRAHPPTTSKEMVKLLIDTTGVDLSGPMSAVYDDAAGAGSSP